MPKATPMGRALLRGPKRTPSPSGSTMVARSGGRMVEAEGTPPPAPAKGGRRGTGAYKARVKGGI